jgi:hypothetical protein
MLNKTSAAPRSNSAARAIGAIVLLLLASAALDIPAHQAWCFLSAALQHLLVLLPSLAMSAADSLRPVTENTNTSHCAFTVSVVWPLLQTTVRFS